MKTGSTADALDLLITQMTEQEGLIGSIESADGETLLVVGRGNGIELLKAVLMEMDKRGILSGPHKLSEGGVTVP